MARNNLKYLRVDVDKREAMRAAWNRPVIWPAILLGLLLALSVVPAVLAYRRRERMAAKPA
jgi:oligopeptide transport system substrate-binding protein